MELLCWLGESYELNSWGRFLSIVLFNLNDASGGQSIDCCHCWRNNRLLTAPIVPEYHKCWHERHLKVQSESDFTSMPNCPDIALKQNWILRSFVRFQWTRIFTLWNILIIMNESTMDFKWIIDLKLDTSLRTNRTVLLVQSTTHNWGIFMLNEYLLPDDSSQNELRNILIRIPWDFPPTSKRGLSVLLSNDLKIHTKTVATFFQSRTTEVVYIIDSTVVHHIAVPRFNHLHFVRSNPTAFVC